MDDLLGRAIKAPSTFPAYVLRELLAELAALRGGLSIPPLAGMKEAVVILGVNRARVDALRKSHPGFPQPIAHLAATPVWLRSDLQTFRDLPRPAGQRLTIQPSPGFGTSALCDESMERPGYCTYHRMTHLSHE